MAKCECIKEKDISILSLNQDRILKLFDKNGKESLEVRLVNLENMEKTVNNLVESTEILRKTQSAYQKAKETLNEYRRERFANTVKIIGLSLVVAGLAYEIFFK